MGDQKKRPNIIIINPDEMRADSLCHLGNRAAVTPALDQFAKDDAVSFSNAYCQNPVCVPSRISMFSGLYPHVHGHRTMSYLLREGESSLFSELKKAGYYVWMNSRNDLVSGQIPGLIEEHASEIFYGGDKETVNRTEVSAKPGDENYYSMFSGRINPDDNGKVYSSDDESVDAAIQKIREHAGSNEPLCIFLGLLNPHPPYQVEEPYYSMIDRNKLRPRIKAADCRGKAEILELIRKNQKLGHLTESDWDGIRACYLGMCAKVDKLFGKVCQALREAGEYDNSAIFFLSDHGDFTGDYGLSEKAQNSFEDCLVRVPLLIKPPKGAPADPGISESMVELVDFYATVMDYAGIQSDHSHFGRSLRPVINDRSYEIREFSCCEGGRMPDEVHCDEFHANGKAGTNPASPYWPRHYAQTDNEAHSKGYMLRTHKWKYISRINGKEELYDLGRDPDEKVNVSSCTENTEVLNSLRRDMQLWLMKTADIVPFDYDKRFTPEMTWAKLKNIVPKEHEQEIRRRVLNGENQFILINECRRRFGNVRKEKEDV